MSSHVTFELIKHGLALARRKQELTRPTYMNATMAEWNLFFDLSQGRQPEIIPPTRFQQMAGEIVDVQSLHHQDDRPFAFVIEPGGHGFFIPIDDTPPRDFRCRVVRLYRIVYNNE